VRNRSRRVMFPSEEAADTVKRVFEAEGILCGLRYRGISSLAGASWLFVEIPFRGGWQGDAEANCAPPFKERCRGTFNRASASIENRSRSWLARSVWQQKKRLDKKSDE